jgi:hypothetical protein
LTVSINETEVENGYFQKRLPAMWQSLRLSDSYSGVQINIQVRHKSVNRCTFCRWSYFR